jgi:hypothetical protein
MVVRSSFVVALIAACSLALPACAVDGTEVAADGGGSSIDEPTDDPTDDPTDGAIFEQPEDDTPPPSDDGSDTLEPENRRGARACVLTRYAGYKYGMAGGQPPPVPSDRGAFSGGDFVPLPGLWTRLPTRITRSSTCYHSATAAKTCLHSNLQNRLAVRAQIAGGVLAPGQPRSARSYLQGTTPLGAGALPGLAEENFTLPGGGGWWHFHHQDVRALQIAWCGSPTGRFLQWTQGVGGLIPAGALGGLLTHPGGTARTMGPRVVGMIRQGSGLLLAVAAGELLGNGLTQLVRRMNAGLGRNDIVPIPGGQPIPTPMAPPAADAPPQPGDCASRAGDLCLSMPGGSKLNQLYHGETACGPPNAGLPLDCENTRNCTLLERYIRRAARCYEGRILSRDLCFGGTLDANHRPPLNRAKRLYDNCFKKHGDLRCRNHEALSLGNLGQEDREQYYCK